MSSFTLSTTNPFTSAPAQPKPAPVELPEPRRIRVSYASRFHDGVDLAALTLRGRWLEEAGFPTGTDTDVRVMPGCIVITARAPEPEEPPLMKSLRRVCRLSARKQQQVQEFIDVVASKRKKTE
ncbi:endoribonuclease SymE [Cronobacter dublinensis]|uniref:endoribonuclease SymE n=1 Tax=Cronobacter dublinensis TaxID=413497 RepID=UPI000CFC8579|nr:endoribonuclease SymE [Cronobacter dublinensis]